jgi:hypothetical protein
MSFWKSQKLIDSRQSTRYNTHAQPTQNMGRVEDRDGLLLWKIVRVLV